LDFFDVDFLIGSSDDVVGEWKLEDRAEEESPNI